VGGFSKPAFVEVSVQAPPSSITWWVSETFDIKFFGDALGDPLADELLSRLRQSPGGLTRTELSNALCRNRTAADLGRALTRLAEHRLATAKMEETSGRSAERWFATVGAASLPSSNSFNSYGVRNVSLVNIERVATGLKTSLPKLFEHSRASESSAYIPRMSPGSAVTDIRLGGKRTHV
jgi:hypothetical protein